MNTSDPSPAKKHQGLYTTLENRPIDLLSLDDEEFQLWQEFRSAAGHILANIDETRRQLEATLAEKGRAVSPWSQFENLWNERAHTLYQRRGNSSEDEVQSLLCQLHGDLSARIGISLGHARLGVTCADELECVHLDYEDGWESLAQVTGVDQRRLLAIACGAHCTFGEFREIAQKLQLRPVCVPLLSEADVRSVPADIAPVVEKPLKEVLSIADAIPLEDVESTVARAWSPFGIPNY